MVQSNLPRLCYRWHTGKLAWFACTLACIVGLRYQRVLAGHWTLQVNLLGPCCWSAPCIQSETLSYASLYLTGEHCTRTAPCRRCCRRKLDLYTCLSAARLGTFYPKLSATSSKSIWMYPYGIIVTCFCSLSPPLRLKRQHGHTKRRTEFTCQQHSRNFRFHEVGLNYAPWEVTFSQLNI